MITPSTPPAFRPSHASNARARAPSDEGEDEVKETVCTVVVKELDPRSIMGWGRLAVLSWIRTAHVIASVRHVKFADVIGGVINTALMFSFSCVFSSAIFGEIGAWQPYIATRTLC
jgi:hypothetical protein